MSKLDRNEIAASRDGRDITRGFLSPLMLAPIEDRVLVERGGGDYRVYEDILRDDHVRAGVNQRAHGIIARPWEVTPGGDRPADLAAAEFLRETIESLEWDRITLEMLSGVFYGFSVAEALWVKDGRFVRLDDLKVRNRRRFGFDGQGRLRMQTLAQPMPGELMPERKFWIARFGADHADAPYGLGLAHYLYWPVWLKRNGMKFWAVYLEKFGTPTVVGKYPAGTTAEDQRKLLQAGEAVARDTTVTIPDGMLLELLEATRAGTAEHEAFAKIMNEAILMICLGQTSTAKGTAGALGNADERERVKDAILRADADVLSASFNRTIATWLTEWNFPGAAPPTVWRTFDDEDLDRRVAREKTIVDMGVGRPTLRHIQDVYGGEWEAVTADVGARDQGPGAKPDEPPADFREPAPRYTPDQQALEDLIAGLVPRGAEAAGQFAAKIDAAIAQAKSFEDVQILLAELMDQQDNQMQDDLTRGMLAADLFGREQASLEQAQHGN